MIADTRIRPLADRVLKTLVEREATTKSGLFLPAIAARECPTEDVMLAVDEGRRDDEGTLIPMQIKVGDTGVQWN